MLHLLFKSPFLYISAWRKAPYPSNVSTGFLYSQAGDESRTADGEYDFYDGGGYIVNLGNDEATAQNIIKSLELDNWIDRLTRAIIVEFALYNANTNLFTVAKVIVETPATGGILVLTRVESFRPYPYVEPWDFVLLVLQIVWLILVMYYIVTTSIKIVKERFTYFRGYWNFCQFVIITMCVGAIVTFILRITTIIYTVESLKNNAGRCR